MRAIELPFKVNKPILACGADLKGAFAIAQGSKAFLFEGFGDLADLDNFTKYENAVRAAIKRLKIRPEIIACDLHPEYFSTQFAETCQPSAISFQLYRIQHHEAHVASAIIDNNLKSKVIGVSFDGTGYGLDGNIWGGEFFVGGFRQFKRVAHFGYVPMPGGDAAVKEPWRMAVSYLYHTFGRKFQALSVDLIKSLDKKQCGVIKEIIDKKINSPLTSSAGRLFDAIGSLVLAKHKSEFEAEFPIELEKLAIELCQDRYDFEMRSKFDMIDIDYSKTIRSIVKDLSKRIDRSTVSSKFHNTVASAISETCGRLRKKFKVYNVVLTGGVFQNKFLSARASALLKRASFNVYTHTRVSTNDSGTPVGQVAIANYRKHASG